MFGIVEQILLSGVDLIVPLIAIRILADLIRGILFGKGD